MKRKLLFVSLVATLSTVGFAAPSIDGVVNLKPVVNPSAGNGMVSDSHLKDAIDNINNNFGDISLELVDQIARQEETEALDKEQNGRLDEHDKDLNGLHGEVSEIKGEIAGIDWTNKEQDKELANQKAELEKHEQALAGKVDKGEFDAYAGTVDGMNIEIDNINSQIGNINGQLDQKVDKNTYEDDKKAQADKDAAQDTAIGNKVDKNTYEDDKKAQADKDAAQDGALKTESDARKEADEKLAAQMDKFQGQMNNYGSRIDNLEKRVDNLDDKLNKGLSLMAAMNAVDFQDVSEGEMAIGAGVGHYGNAQSVAIGVAYAPTQNLNVNMKYSVTAGDVDSFAIGAGASYKFRVK